MKKNSFYLFSILLLAFIFTSCVIERSYETKVIDAVSDNNKHTVTCYNLSNISVSNWYLNNEEGSWYANAKTSAKNGITTIVNIPDGVYSLYVQLEDNYYLFDTVTLDDDFNFYITQVFVDKYIVKKHTFYFVNDTSDIVYDWFLKDKYGNNYAKSDQYCRIEPGEISFISVPANKYYQIYFCLYSNITIDCYYHSADFIFLEKDYTFKFSDVLENNGNR